MQTVQLKGRKDYLIRAELIVECYISRYIASLQTVKRKSSKNTFDSFRDANAIGEYRGLVQNPAIMVIGVQSHASPPWYYSFKEGKLVSVEYKDFYAEGLYGGINQSNLDLLLQIVDDFVLVEEESIAMENLYMIEVQLQWELLHSVIIFYKD
jgi:hypothetical protein